MSPAVQRVLDALEAVGCPPHPNGAGWTARCPGHDDSHPSLAIGVGNDNRALLTCHAGCSLDSILRPLGLEPRDLFASAPTSGAPRESRYRICDPAGGLVAIHVRRDGSGGKRFHWEREGRPGLNGLRVADLPLYGSEKVGSWSASEPVFVCEGEKAADALRAHGFAAVATICGAAATPSIEPLRVLQDRNVILWPDADKPGISHMTRVAGLLCGLARSVKQFVWPGAPERGDAADFFEAGYTTADATELMLRAATISPSPVGPSPSSPSKTDVRQGAVPTRADDEPWTEPVDGAKLLDELAATLRRYVSMPDAAAHAAALWVVMTYLLDHVPFAVRLIASSPTRACGKTRLLTVLSALARRAEPASSITPAALFRLIEAHAPTLILDEMDNARLRENDELRALLNSGHARTAAYVIRTVGRDHEPRRFSTWCAIALAAIGSLPDTLTSRAVVLSLQRNRRGTAVARLREARVRGEMTSLRRMLTRWGADHGPAVGEREPELPRALDGRAADNAAVLVAIADEAGGAWPELARRSMCELSGVVSDEVPGVQLLADMRDLFERQRSDRLASEDIVRALRQLETRPWAEWTHGQALSVRGLARLLRPFGIVPGSVKWPDGSTRKGYLRSWFEDAFARYLSAPSGTPAPAANDAAESRLPDAAPAEPVPDAGAAPNPQEPGLVPQCRARDPRHGCNSRVDPFDLPPGVDL